MWYSGSVNSNRVLGIVKQQSARDVCFNAVVDGTLAGTFYVEYSAHGDVSGSWTRDPDANMPFTAGETTMLELVYVVAPYVRFGIDSVTGSGQVNAAVYNKGR